MVSLSVYYFIIKIFYIACAYDHMIQDCSSNGECNSNVRATRFGTLRRVWHITRTNHFEWFLVGSFYSFFS